MVAAEYAHVVLGLLFLKYISAAFEAKHAALEAERVQGADLEDPDAYRAANTYWVPSHDRQRCGRGNGHDRAPQPLALSGDIGWGELGDSSERGRGTLGRVYGYFLSHLASAEGKNGGQFYTPSHVVRVLLEMLATYRGRVYEPCCYPRRTDRRQIPQRRPPRPQGRLRARQSALQRQRLTRRSAQGRHALGLRHPTARQRQLQKHEEWVWKTGFEAVTRLTFEVYVGI